MWILTYCWQKNHNLWIQAEFNSTVDWRITLFGFNVDSDLLLNDPWHCFDSIWILTSCWQKNGTLWIQCEFWPIVDRRIILFGFNVNSGLLLKEESHSLVSMWILTYCWKKNVYLIIFKFTMNLEYFGHENFCLKFSQNFLSKARLKKFSSLESSEVVQMWQGNLLVKERTAKPLLSLNICFLFSENWSSQPLIYLYMSAHFMILP